MATNQFSIENFLKASFREQLSVVYRIIDAAYL